MLEKKNRSQTAINLDTLTIPDDLGRSRDIGDGWYTILSGYNRSMGKDAAALHHQAPRAGEKRRPSGIGGRAYQNIASAQFPDVFGWFRKNSGIPGGDTTGDRSAAQFLGGFWRRWIAYLLEGIAEYDIWQIYAQ